MVPNVETLWHSNQKTFVKGIIFVGLLICFGYFVTGVWQNFSSKSTTFKQSVQRTRIFSLPTSTVCFNSPVKKSVIDRYELPQTAFEIFKQSKVNTTYSLSHLFNETSYWLGKDFNIYSQARTNNYNPLKLHIGNNNVPYCENLVSDNFLD